MPSRRLRAALPVGEIAGYVRGGSLAASPQVTGAPGSLSGIDQIRPEGANRTRGTGPSCGYGLGLDQDMAGARWTRVTTGVQGIRAAQSFWRSEIEPGYEPPAGTVIAALPGWPVLCALALLGLPEPHDRRPPSGRPTSRTR